MISILLALVVCISSLSLHVFAIDSGNTDINDNFIVFDAGHGSYSLLQNKDNISFAQTSGIRIQKIDDNIYFFEDNPELKLLKVNNSTLQEVKEIRIEIDNKQVIDNIIDKYNLCEAIANDLIKLNKGALENDWSNINVILFMPEQLSTSTDLAKAAGNYYVGYNNWKYQDYLVSVNAQSTYVSLPQLSGTIAAVANIIISKFLDNTPLGPSYTLASLFTPLFQSYSTSTEISSMVSSVEFSCEVTLKKKS
ncbi:hypothetical protein SDC9_61439 [bioreactor metagenome]|uniref:Uncharacterized protein n=1 Tax=bioreactor metagenome TaxID=1076179 RepID=A0A644XLG7_9ZZZZ